MLDCQIPAWTSVRDLPRAHGEPLGQGRIRVAPEDFQVEEILGFEPDGEGDHLLLWVRKTSANTEWVARKLAGLLQVPSSTIGYAGLKDRHAITLQWFSVPRPRQGESDWTRLESLGIQVLAEHPHRRKLKRGALAGNRFRLLIRDFSPSAPLLERRLGLIRDCGVPDYFGEQRFGHDDGNLRRAHDLLTGQAGRVSRHERGLWLSAARSQIFNELLAERVRLGNWDQPIPGDCLQLDGSHSYFLAEDIDDALTARAAAMDLHPSGPLWGEGELATRGEIRHLESALAARFSPWPTGLSRLGMRQERRSLRLQARDLVGAQSDAGLRLELTLPAGAYATAVLREILVWA
ncbi:tRNA pseudouridine(13) synthase TruD [Thiorhodococcus mannitoliphagus]|uniref:tRNA pseudouridine synthase D n=2 Tax=Thiorhodococcus mannitoliphagus TaxID=329406 RepID=A0A6P1DU26_9GAMM|nr:tRNA pseudouridine(13) synthase TruD [Thiorhodococcus mannitoliphagus]NEX20196.1 tRNA pseudouridine(13) synthase TruD [Thiorhodococcus mannitoliphagus]